MEDPKIETRVERDGCAQPMLLQRCTVLLPLTRRGEESITIRWHYDDDEDDDKPMFLTEKTMEQWR